MDMLPDTYLGHMIRGYHLEKKLGTGKLTVLYLARTEELWLPPELVVMLIQLPATCSQQARAQFATRFHAMAHKLMKLRHPSLHSFLGYGEEHPYFYLLLPPLAGTTLAQKFQTQQPWSPSETLSLFAPLCNAFDYVHQHGFTYTFLTPTNILLQENQLPQITGLGLLHLLTQHGIDDEVQSNTTENHLKNIAGDYMSTATYLAPEVIQGKHVDGRADIYSLGVILFELLAGRAPFIGDDYQDTARKHIHEPLPSLHDIAPHLPLALERVINRALHRDPAHRFATAGDFITTFSRALDEQRLITNHIVPDRHSTETHDSDLLLTNSGPLTSSLAQNTGAHSIGDPSTEVPLVPVDTNSLSTGSLDPNKPPASSIYKNIDKMAQQMQRLRQRIQGEYSQ